VNSEKLKSWLALGANFGVLIGLVVLIFEIDQNTDMMRAQMHDSFTASTENVRTQIFAADLNKVRVRLIEADLFPVRREFIDELSVFEKLVLSDWFAVILAGNANNYYQCQEGFLDSEVCEATFNSVNEFLILGMHALDRDMRGHRSSFIAEMRRFAEEAGLPVIGEDGTWD
jgi:hypothetical protein